MKPIRDISELQTGSVLYHSAFGFARVVAVTHERVELAWEETAANLPSQVPHDVLARVYAKCEADGFFQRATADPVGATEQLQTHAVDALCDLLADLGGPQRPIDLRDWIVGRRLLSNEGFERWWRMIQPLVTADPRLEQRDGMVVRCTPPGGPHHERATSRPHASAPAAARDRHRSARGAQ